eukprot:7233892-Alexandrium_andersonii.AAC.1
MMRGVRQGAYTSPAIWALALDGVLARLEAAWKANGWGFSLRNFPASLLSEDQCFPFFAFADDIILMAVDGAQLASMTNKLCLELATVGLQLQADKCPAVFNRRCNVRGPPAVGNQQ